MSGFLFFTGVPALTLRMTCPDLLGYLQRKTSFYARQVEAANENALAVVKDTLGAERDALAARVRPHCVRACVCVCVCVCVRACVALLAREREREYVAGQSECVCCRVVKDTLGVERDAFAARVPPIV